MILAFNWLNDLSESSFIVDETNENAYRWLFNDLLWPKNQLVLSGPKYSGKSHLASIWSLRNDAVLIGPESDPSHITTNFVVDSVESTFDEYKFMELFRMADYFNVKTLWVSNQDYLEFELTDLRTRFASMVRMTIEEPSEFLFKAVVRKRCSDFGLTITDECLDYIAKRVEITYLAIDKLVLNIHYECLQQQKPPSVMLVHDVISRF